MNRVYLVSSRIMSRNNLCLITPSSGSQEHVLTNQFVLGERLELALYVTSALAGLEAKVSVARNAEFTMRPKEVLEQLEQQRSLRPQRSAETQRKSKSKANLISSHAYWQSGSNVNEDFKAFESSHEESQLGSLKRRRRTQNAKNTCTEHISIRNDKNWRRRDGQSP